MNLQNNDYGAKDIKTLEGIDAIRLRAGMYIGSTGLDGVHHIILEVISNCIDEYLNGHCTTCNIEVGDLEKGEFIVITDDGRGIPFGKAEDGSETLINVFTKLHTGAKFDSEGKTGYNTSGGMNGIGVKATNALSEYFNVSVTRNRHNATVGFKQGKLFCPFEVKEIKSEQHGTSIQFRPDPQIFKEGIQPDYNRLHNQLEELAYLSPGLTFNFKYEDKPEETIKSNRGIIDYIEKLNEKKEVLTSTFFLDNIKDRIGVKIAMLYNNSYSDTYKLYTNSIPNSGGTHLTGFRTALTQSINEFAKANKLLKDKDANITGDELKEGLSVIISLIMPDPVFSGQTKDTLTSSEARTIVQRFAASELLNWLNKNPKDGKAIVNKALLARKARESAKKAKDAARKITNQPKGLRSKMQISSKFIDCANKNPSDRNLLLVEGLSAGSAAVEARNAKTDCIYMLRGKIISPLKTDITKLLANQEISDIIQVIGAGFKDAFDVNKMNFNKIVITTDSDSDGADIELLLITFFYTYMRPLVEVGKLYRAVTPLYIVRNKKEELYFYTEKEMEDFRKTGVKGYDVLRAKGLGELNAEDLKKVCFEHERFKRITISDAQKTTQLLDILQGPAVQPRKQYIYDNAHELGFHFD